MDELNLKFESVGRRLNAAKEKGGPMSDKLVDKYAELALWHKLMLKESDIWEKAKLLRKAGDRAGAKELERTMTNLAYDFLTGQGGLEEKPLRPVGAGREKERRRALDLVAFK